MINRKKIIMGIAIAVPCLLLSPIAIFYGILAVHDSMDYQKCKKAVKSHMEDYDFDYTIIRREKGKNAYPAERCPDSYYVHDETNDVYFVVTCRESGAVISDEHREKLAGKHIAQELADKLPDKNFTANFSVKKDSLNGSLVYYGDFSEENSKQLYEMYLYLSERCEYTDVNYYIAPEEKKPVFEKLYRYGGNDLLKDLSDVYTGHVSGSTMHIAAWSEFHTAVSNPLIYE